jgi:hypothetical protein
MARRFLWGWLVLLAVQSGALAEDLWVKVEVVEYTAQQDDRPGGPVAPREGKRQEAEKVVLAVTVPVQVGEEALVKAQAGDMAISAAITISEVSGDAVRIAKFRHAWTHGPFEGSGESGRWTPIRLNEPQRLGQVRFKEFGRTILKQAIILTVTREEPPLGTKPFRSNKEKALLDV